MKGERVIDKLLGHDFNDKPALLELSIWFIADFDFSAGKTCKSSSSATLCRKRAIKPISRLVAVAAPRMHSGNNCTYPVGFRQLPSGNWPA